MKVLPADVLRSPKGISTLLRAEIRELQNSGKKVLKVTVGIQVQGAAVPPAWRKALEAFSDGTNLRELYEHIEGELGASGTGQQRKIGEKNMRRRKHSQFLSTLRRLSNRGVLTLRPSSFLDSADRLARTDTDSTRSQDSGNSDTRRGWAEEISTAWVQPNVRMLRTETGTQASWTEERTVTLRKKGEGAGDIIIEGLAAKPIHLTAVRQSRPKVYHNT